MKTIKNFESPDGHYDVASTLLSGKFILHTDSLFDIIHDNINYYTGFFRDTYNFELIKTTEVIYLSSLDSTENFSKNMMLILAVFVYEINLQGKNIYEELMMPFTLKKISDIIENSSYSKVCKSIDLEKFLSRCERRNIVKKTHSDSMKFTAAVHVFLEHAKRISEIDTCKSVDV